MGTVWVLKGTLLAFPSQWVLAEKIGKPIGTIHAPASGYGDVLERPVDQFFKAMLKGSTSQQRNWVLQIDDGLFTHSRFDHAPTTTDEIASHLFVRVKILTLRKLPSSGWIVFTIQNAMAPKGMLRDDQPARDELAALNAGMLAAEGAYRGIDEYLPRLHPWMTCQP